MSGLRVLLGSMRFLFLGAAMMSFAPSVLSANDSYSYKRTYRDGDVFEYRLATTNFTNGNQDREEVGISRHSVVVNGTPRERLTWQSLVLTDSNGTRDLTAEAIKVAPYEISLSDGGSINIPSLNVKEMIGMITDLNTFYVAISPGLGITNVQKVGEKYLNPNLLKGVWTNGTEIVVGEDCTQATIEMLDLDSTTATYKSTFGAPASDCIDLKYEWMKDPVLAGSKNNFQQITKAGAEKFQVMWGNEWFSITSKVDRTTGKIISAEMDNQLTLRMRMGCSSGLEKCDAEFPLTIGRQLQLSERCRSSYAR